MRRFLEFKGQSFRLDYDRDRADFVVKTEPHPFVVRKPATEIHGTEASEAAEPSLIVSSHWVSAPRARSAA